jgi:CRP/FNR family cyclic AMP-dependent transcriptional regulator
VLRAICAARRIRLRKGEEAESWLGIISGIVKINNFSPAGKSVTFTGVPAGSWFGEGLY